MFDYMTQFWRKYKTNRKFSLMLTNFAHENTLEKLKYIDNIIYNYFNAIVIIFFHNLFPFYSKNNEFRNSIIDYLMTTY